MPYWTLTAQTAPEVHMRTAAREVEITRLAHHIAKDVHRSPFMTEALRYFATYDREPQASAYEHDFAYPRVGSIKALAGRRGLIIRNAQGSYELTVPGREVARILFAWIPTYRCPQGAYSVRTEFPLPGATEQEIEVGLAEAQAYAEADVRRADAELFPANLVDDQGFLLATPRAAEVQCSGGGPGHFVPSEDVETGRTTCGVCGRAINLRTNATIVPTHARPAMPIEQPTADEYDATDSRTAQELNSDPAWTTTPDSPPAMIAGGLLRSNEDTVELMRLARAEQAETFPAFGAKAEIDECDDDDRPSLRHREPHLHAMDREVDESGHAIATPEDEYSDDEQI